MLQQSTVEPICIPLSFDEIVREIHNFTDLPEQEVRHRVWMEAMNVGWNVLQDVPVFQVKPHHFDDKMSQLYRESYGFIFETLVFWVSPSRQKWIESALNRIHLYAKNQNLKPEQVKILMLGDGTGNDSLFLVKNGFKIDYFDFPGSKTSDFTTKRFASYGLLKKFVNIITDYNLCLSQQYDVILSFEVLEHLTDPPTAIREISSMLKSNGIALITESFSKVRPNLPTHLAANSKYDGLTACMFLKYNMMLSWYERSTRGRPMEFSKLGRTSVLSVVQLFQDKTIRESYFRAITRNFKQNCKQVLKRILGKNRV
ncbi:MAG: methyltransferase domain-containing protein [Scytonema sp. PMC 1069.18]|nr:methyltransferase domain-containing protein [Scytonema sp. PMC 1069.18]MEC4885924.1 methyltransferase domain-containing protein [Scytonema sp. PMC 1070.18]